jgi:hypothetical protein
MKRWIIPIAIYGIAGLTTANWLDYVLTSPQYVSIPGVFRTFLYVTLCGSAAFAANCCIVPFSQRFGALVGAVGLLLSWPYFGWLVLSISWKDFSYLVKYRGIDDFAAIGGLLLVTFYYFFTVRRLLVRTRWCIDEPFDSDRRLGAAKR